MAISSIPVDEVCVGDIVEVSEGVQREIEDLRDNSRMGGVWLDFVGHSSKFFGYNERVNLIRED